jgi:hypothetical protein
MSMGPSSSSPTGRGRLSHPGLAKARPRIDQLLHILYNMRRQVSGIDGERLRTRRTTSIIATIGIVEKALKRLDHEQGIIPLQILMEKIRGSGSADQELIKDASFEESEDCLYVGDFGHLRDTLRAVSQRGFSELTYDQLKAVNGYVQKNHPLKEIPLRRPI